ncbi:tetratricopeptide repeat protein [Paludisphaera soli]|uniref:tetratricopeptide repeat protein n=1 Tax=Paludisphaera soli TaxID=2712865 RepID=UPI0013EA76C4|nr:tetratricopeptide repeat protein [Paludisphaera soli]
MGSHPSPARGGVASRRSRKTAAAAVLAVGIVAAGVMIRGELRVMNSADAARRATADARFSEAEAALERWIAARPRAAEPHFLLARVAVALGRPQEAIARLHRARALGHPAGPVDRLDAILRARAGRHAEAEPVLRQVLAGSDAPDPEAAEALARVYLETFDLRAAAEVLERWIRDAPRDATPYLWRTEIASRLDGDQLARVRDFSAALERDPTLDRARLGLADALRLAGRPDEAEEDYEAYIARRPDDPAGHRGAGLNALDRGDQAEAIRRLDRASALDPADASTLSARAGVSLRLGDFAGALAMLDRAVLANPHDVEIRHRRGLCLDRLGHPGEARAEHDAAARLRDDERRLSELRRSLVRDPKNREIQGQIARWMIEHDHEEEGIRWARNVLRDRPDHASTHRVLAAYYDRSGQPGLANFHRLQAGLQSPPP